MPPKEFWGLFGALKPPRRLPGLFFGDKLGRFGHFGVFGAVLGVFWVRRCRFRGRFGAFLGVLSALGGFCPPLKFGGPPQERGAEALEVLDEFLEADPAAVTPHLRPLLDLCLQVTPNIWGGVSRGGFGGSRGVTEASVPAGGGGRAEG